VVALFPPDGWVVALFPDDGFVVALFPPEGWVVALFPVDGFWVSLLCGFAWVEEGFEAPVRSLFPPPPPLRCACEAKDIDNTKRQTKNAVMIGAA
jgi:hypothetical protein